MSSLFAKVQQNAAGIETKEVDFTGFSRTIPTNVYDGEVRLMYLDQTEKGTLFVSLELVLKVDGKDRTYKETIYISNQQGEFEYTDKKDGTKKTMMGFTAMDTLAKLTLGKPLISLSTEVRKIKVYNPATRQEEPMDKEIFMDMLKKPVKVAIVEKTEDKYNSPGETVDRNSIEKFLDADTGMTINEREAHASNPEIKAGWVDGWVKNNAGVKQNRAKKAGQAGGAQQGRPSQGGQQSQVGGLF